MAKRIRQFFIIMLALTVTTIVVLASLDLYVSFVANNRVYTDVAEIPHRPVALVLGTSKYIGKRINHFYPPRLDAAQSLFKHNKVQAVIVSGDNATRYYNEPQTMANDLVRAGVPRRYVVKDYAGFRTLDSVVRAKLIFGQEALTIVSQRFHCERAIYIARAIDIDALCLSADDAQGLGAIKIRLREVLARAKAVLDINILNKQPKFLGELETVILRASPPRSQYENP
ncbi:MULTISPECIES: ElyC/SanA/YdcF family protein [unclassified Motilimonas]|uniref:SanA/YdcF family protein n=1 Tax=Motilimonas TaxID=1914248 RepID=UPI001E43B445|nr:MULTISPECIES: ElyC/SanA/YdcF family protein [unclassified Motilimonas]MDO6526283.1 ElyC/SanA/YdcF family protein [Motilimonas sp. 1_MG-2023]